MFSPDDLGFVQKLILCQYTYFLSRVSLMSSAKGRVILVLFLSSSITELYDWCGTGLLLIICAAYYVKLSILLCQFCPSIFDCQKRNDEKIEAY